MKFRRTLSLIAVAILSHSALGEVVNVYSARHYDTDMALYQNFTEITGIDVNLIEGRSDSLIERIKSEGDFSPADILITVDAGRLWRAEQQGIFQPVESKILNERIPSHLRDPKGMWFGLSKRARVVVYNEAEGLPEGFSDYEDLANQKLRGRVCMRSSSNIYNLSLMASLINAIGEEQALRWAEGVVANFARKPQSNDTGQLRAVASGECGITIANTYYLGRLMNSNQAKDKDVINKTAVLFANQEGRGTHVNVSGAGITKNSPNRLNAIRFLEYLTSEEAQRLFAEGNNEFPIVGKPTGPIAKLSEFKEDKLNAFRLGEQQTQAVKIYDQAGWN